MSVKPLSFGIVGIAGAPGSGKSLYTVREITHLLINHRRPIYTNVPLKPKKFRAYLMLKARRRVRRREVRRALINLVKPCTFDHFDRFCKRLGRVSDLTDRLIEKSGVDPNNLEGVGEFVHTECVKRALRISARCDGEYVLVGKDADWFPPGSIFFLDELHKWYPSSGYRNESKELLAFTSMHRHLQFRIYVMTQRWKNVSLSFRAMADEVWYAVNWSKQPILGIFRIHRWINVFRYQHFNGFDVEEGSGVPRIGAKPIWSELYCPEWSGALEFDCYRSHSHGGSLEEQQKEMKAATSAMMGSPATEALAVTEDDAMARRKNWAASFSRLVTRAAFLTLAFWVGRISAPPETVVEREVLPEGVQLVSAEVETASATSIVPALDVDPAWKEQTLIGVMRGRAVLSDRRVNLGDMYDGLQLLGVDPDQGRTIWITEAGEYYGWDIGGVPRRVRPPQEFFEAARKARNSGSAVLPSAGFAATPGR